MTIPDILWTPPPDALQHSRFGAWLRWLETERQLRFDGYHDAWAWSVDDLEGFWSSICSFLSVTWHRPPDRILAGQEMPGTVWCPGATVNYAEHALGAAPDNVAVISVSQTRDATVILSGSELRDLVARARAGLADLGVGRGDRVVAYLPNVAETLIAFLATASLGAVWSSCPPEFGAKGVIDRFAQIEPGVLLTVDGYRHRGRSIDRTEEVAALRAALPGLGATVVVPYLAAHVTSVPGAVTWDELTAGPGSTAVEPVPFDHPLYILFSSGTTGLPKPIVHGHGGVLLEHLKMLALHHDMGPDDRFFWFSTTGWMMWNYVVSGLLVGASIVLFDGDPGHPDLGVLWRLAAEHRVTHFGTSAPFLLACEKAGLDPAKDVDLSAVREVGSTGAPLPAHGFRWVYDRVKSDVVLASVSGGTDVCTAFVGGAPVLPVFAGEITCRCLGARVEAYDEHGQPVIDKQASLVVTAPMPSMPVGLWGDTDGSRYRAAYFETFPGVWDHGDWITITARGTCVITGRSDSTLNRGGVRLGTSDFYAVVEALPEISDSLVIHLDDPDGGPGELLLFVTTAEGSKLDDDLRDRICRALRANLSPRHVPDRTIEVQAIPRTLSGKKLEVPVKRILMGMSATRAASKDSMAEPAALEPFEALAAERASRRWPTEEVTG
jgi:acetoacetyl-CoA synthetase